MIRRLRDFNHPVYDLNQIPYLLYLICLSVHPEMYLDIFTCNSQLYVCFARRFLLLDRMITYMLGCQFVLNHVETLLKQELPQRSKPSKQLEQMLGKFPLLVACLI